MALNRNQYIRFGVFRINGIDIKIDTLEGLEIFEDLEVPGIYGNIYLKDFSNLKDIKSISSNDTLELSFGRENEPQVEVNDLVITDSYGDEITDQRDLSQKLKFGFANKWLVKGTTRKRSRHFRNKRIDQIVKILLEDSDANVGEISETTQILDRYVTPYIPPIDSIRNLMDFAINAETGNGGYVLWTELDTGRVNFKTISELIAPATSSIVNFKLNINNDILENPSTVFKIEVKRHFDMMEFGKIGFANSKIVGFNYDRTEIMETDTRIDEYLTNHLSPKSVQPQDFLGRIFRPTNDSFRFPNTSTLIETKADAKSHIDGRLKSMYSHIMADSVELTVDCYGEVAEKRIGKLIWLNYPRIEGHILNREFTGTYLIKKIHHKFSGPQHGQTLTLVSDGYKENPREDRIDWSTIDQTVISDTEIDMYDVERGEKPSVFEEETD